MDPLLQDQADLHALLDHDDTFDRVTVLIEDRGDIEADVLQQLATLNTKAGRSGAVAVVLAPEELPSEADTPNPELRVRLQVQVLEDQLFNLSATGTQLSCYALARRIRQLGHRRSFGRGVWSWAGTVAAPQESPSRRSLIVTFERLDHERRATKLGRPLIEPEEGGAVPQAVTLTPPDGAEAWFTLDGSTPVPTNPQARRYVAELNLAEPCTLRAAAYAAGAEPSDISAATFT